MQYQSRPISLTERYVYHSSVLAVPARNVAGASMPVEGAQPVIEKFEQFKQRIATIQRQLDDEKRTAAAGVLADIRECVRLFGLTPRDIFGDAIAAPRRQRAPKYWDPVSGRTWSGIGREPAWIKGRDRAAFALDRSGSEPDDAAEAVVAPARTEPGAAKPAAKRRAAAPASVKRAARRR